MQRTDYGRIPWFNIQESYLRMTKRGCFYFVSVVSVLVFCFRLLGEFW